MKKYVRDVESRTLHYLEKFSLEELNHEIVVPWGDKPDTRVRIEKVLTHMVFEDMIHYGELSAALWQMDLEAPCKAFWRYQQQT